MQCVLGAERGMDLHRVCVRNETEHFIIKVIQPLQNRHRETFWGDRNVLKLGVVTVAYHSEFIEVIGLYA